jgi:hypothetical protein
MQKLAEDKQNTLVTHKSKNCKKSEIELLPDLRRSLARALPKLAREGRTGRPLQKQK